MLETFLAILFITIVVFFILAYLRLKNRYTSLRMKFEAEVANKATSMFQGWREKELQFATSQIEENVKARLNAEFNKWLQEKEAEIRRDAVFKSVSTILGKASEHIAPLFLLEKHEIDMRDLRFIGTPIDFIAFKGLSKGNPSEIVFIEVKSGRTAQLTPREKSVRDLVEKRKISWLTLRLIEETGKAKETIEREVTSIPLTSPPQPLISTIFCYKCGTKLRFEDAYCFICGEKVKSSY